MADVFYGSLLTSVIVGLKIIFYFILFNIIQSLKKGGKSGECVVQKCFNFNLILQLKIHVFQSYTHSYICLWGPFQGYNLLGRAGQRTVCWPCSEEYQTEYYALRSRVLVRARPWWP